MWFEKSEAWAQQSLLLLKARPSNARVTTKYHLLDPSLEPKKSRRRTAPKTESTDEATAKSGSEAKAVLVLKTFDTASGTCLKYKTTKAAEVGRLISWLHELGRVMAAIPPLAEDKLAAQPAATEEISRTGTPLPEAAKGAADSKPSQGPGGAGGGKKKKKGKK